MRRLLPLIVALFLAAVFAAGCGSSGHKTSAPTSTGQPSASAVPAQPSSSSVIVIKSFAYMPSTLTVSPGAEVTVQNQDTAPHTVTAVSPNNGGFDTGDIQPGSTKTFKAPTKPGTYPYICTIHQFMHGTLVVQ